ncbi:FEX1, partial [Symbiodinium sp. CCMP2456]
VRSIFQSDSKLVTALCVAYFALLGCALRVAIDLWLKGLDFGVTTSDPGPFRVFSHRCYKRSTASGYFFQNVLGCILMATVARHKKAMNQHLATGLASGLCGSLTTWATWMGEVAATITNGFVFQAFVSVVCMLCVSLSTYRLGHFLAGCGMEDEPKCFDEYCGLRILFSHEEKRADDSEEDTSDEDRGAGAEDEEWGLQVDHPATWREPERKQVFLSDAVHIAIVAIAFVIIALFFGVSAGRDYESGLLDMAFAPFGALLRWWLSLFNKYTAPFPLFTLIANTLGCLCNALGGVYEARASSELGRAALAALSTGFAGSLSTVSTLISELRSDTLGGLRL